MYKCDPYFLFNLSVATLLGHYNITIYPCYGVTKTPGQNMGTKEKGSEKQSLFDIFFHQPKLISQVAVNVKPIES